MPPPHHDGTLSLVPSTKRNQPTLVRSSANFERPSHCDEMNLGFAKTSFPLQLLSTAKANYLVTPAHEGQHTIQSTKDNMTGQLAYHDHADGKTRTPLLNAISPTSPGASCRSTDPTVRSRNSSANGTRGRTSSRNGPITRESRPTTIVMSPSASPNNSRRSFAAGHRLRSISPAAMMAEASSVNTKWKLAAIFLAISLVTFCVQTELSKVIQTDLGWNKAYCMLYLTHSSWTLLYPLQLLVLRLRKRHVPWAVFWRVHRKMLFATAWEVQHQKTSQSRRTITLGTTETRSVIFYLAWSTLVLTGSLTFAGLSWYVAINLTSPSDLTAIYNCSAFFAYIFAVPLLKEPLHHAKSAAVLVAIIGVLVVAYGDSSPADHGADTPSIGSRLSGNIIIGIGSILYGLYEVLYKRLACPPVGASNSRSVIFAITAGSLIGFVTLTILWIPLPLLHVLGWEKFELPRGQAAWMLMLSILANATFSGCFLVLISLTGPVVSSVASLLTIFLVALSDWAIGGEPLSKAALVGGLLIIVAFSVLSWSTWCEMKENSKKLKVGMLEEAQAYTISTSDDDSDGEVYGQPNVTDDSDCGTLFQHGKTNVGQAATPYNPVT